MLTKAHLDFTKFTFTSAEKFHAGIEGKAPKEEFFQWFPNPWPVEMTEEIRKLTERIRSAVSQQPPQKGTARQIAIAAAASSSKKKKSVVVELDSDFETQSVNFLDRSRKNHPKLTMLWHTAFDWVADGKLKDHITRISRGLAVHTYFGEHIYKTVYIPILKFDFAQALRSDLVTFIVKHSTPDRFPISGLKYPKGMAPGMKIVHCWVPWDYKIVDDLLASASTPGNLPVNTPLLQADGMRTKLVLWTTMKTEAERALNVILNLLAASNTIVLNSNTSDPTLGISNFRSGSSVERRIVNQVFDLKEVCV